MLKTCQVWLHAVMQIPNLLAMIYHQYMIQLLFTLNMDTTFQFHSQYSLVFISFSLDFGQLLKERETMLLNMMNSESYLNKISFKA